jgi:hypothetical protein
MQGLTRNASNASNASNACNTSSSVSMGTGSLVAPSIAARS